MGLIKKIVGKAKNRAVKPGQNQGKGNAVLENRKAQKPAAQKAEPELKNRPSAKEKAAAPKPAMEKRPGETQKPAMEKESAAKPALEKGIGGEGHGEKAAGKGKPGEGKQAAKEIPGKQGVLEENSAEAQGTGGTATKERSAKIDELMKYLQPGRGVGITVLKNLEELPDHYTVLVMVKRKKYGLLTEELAKYFLGRKGQGIVITTNKPGQNLLESMKNSGIDSSKLFIIDVVSKRSGEEEAAEQNITYVDSPENLTELDAGINEFLEMVQGEVRFLILDSLSTLLVYNSDRTVERFMHSLSGKMRAKEFKAVFTLVSETRPETLGILSQFCDKVIEI